MLVVEVKYIRCGDMCVCVCVGGVGSVCQVCMDEVC